MSERSEKILTQYPKAVHSWADMEQDYQLFTPALLYWRTGLDRDVICEFTNEQSLSGSDRILRADARLQIFSIPDPIVVLTVKDKTVRMDLSRQMYFCPKQHWETLSQFLAGLGFVWDTPDSFAVSVRCPDMRILDPIAIAEFITPVRPVTVAGFGVYSTKAASMWRFFPETMKRPEVVVADPIDLVIKDGKAFWKEHK